MTRQKPLRHDGRDYLTTAQVARRLGVKEQTIYAYVSRGQLVSTRIQGMSGSLFAVDEIEAMAERDGARRGPGGAVERIRTQITLRENENLYFRGVSVAELAGVPIERVAYFLWTGTMPNQADFRSDPDVLARATRAAAALPATARLVDRIRLVVDITGVCDPMRFDTGAASIVHAAPALIATVVDGCSPADAPLEVALAQRLWSAVSDRPGAEEDFAILNSALVVLADHDLAASTLAVRMAASTRANLYAAVTAGLGVMDGPYHGAATTRAYRFLEEAVPDPMGALALRLRDHERIPGFGHIVYDGRDPRAEVLLESMRNHNGPNVDRVVDAAQLVIDHMADRYDMHPNSDFALAVATLGIGLRRDAPEAIFAIARIAGWIAHAIEEYQEKGLRFRVPGIYAGVRPHR